MAAESSERKAGSIPALTGIRFWAAIVVVFYHYNIILDYPFPIPLLREQGRSPVGLFFILSGFILFHNYHERFRDGVTGRLYREFTLARFARVYPMHVVALALMTILVVYLRIAHYNFLRGELHYELSWRLLFVSWLANLLLVQVYVPQNVFENLWNTPSWSIACEVFAYALFPFFAAGRFLRHRGVNSLLVLAFLIWGVELALSLGLAFHLQTLPGNQRAAFADFIGYRLPPFRVWEFFIGCTICAAWTRQREGQETRSLLSFLELPGGRDLLLALALALALTLAAADSFVGGRARETLLFLQLYSLYTPSFALAILAVGSGRTFLSPLLESRLMLLLGEASYSLYILHWVFLYSIKYAKDYGYSLGPFVAPAGILFTVVVSVMFFKSVETPLRRLLRIGMRPQ